MAVDAELGRTSINIDALLGPLRSSLTKARGMVDTEMDKAGDSGGRRLGGRLASAVGRGMATVAKVTAAAAATGTIALAGIGAAGVKAGLQTASAMEQAKVSFTTMLGSGKKADQFLGRLATFAAQTPFEFPELQTAASSLVSAGINANKVIPIMTSLGNATAGMGTGSEGIKRATVALQQMQAAGKITGEDLNQLRDAGVPVFDLLAAATNKSKKEVADLANKGKLGAKELGQLMKALESGKGLERFNGLMDAQSQTLAGQFSTLKDTVSMGLSRAVAPWLPIIKGALNDVSVNAAPFFDWLSKKSADLAKTAGPKIKEVRTAIHELIAGLTLKDAGDIGAPLEGMVAVGYRIRTVFVAVTSAVKNFVAGLQGKGAVDGFSGKLNQAGLGVSALVAAFKSGDVTSDGFVGKMESIGVALGKVRDAVAQAFSNMKSGDASSAGASLGSMADSTARLAPLMTSLAGMIPSLNDGLKVGATVMTFLADHVSLLAKVLPALAVGFAAVKVAQAAGNVAAAAAVPLRVVELVMNRNLAKSNRELAAAMLQNAAAQRATTTSETVSVLSRARAAVVTVAKSVAEKAAAMASRAYAAAQWLVNAALSANPIGLVIIGLVALGAAIVLAWKHSETFRTVVLAAWSAIQVGVSAVVGWLRTAVPAVFAWVKNAFLKFTPLGIVISHWSQIRAGISAAVAGVRAAIGWFAGLPGMFAGWFSRAKSGATTALGALLSYAKGLPGRIVASLGHLGGLLLSAGGDVVRGFAQGIRNAAGNIISAVKEAITDKLPKWVRDRLGIHSPSKVFAQIGYFTGLGFRQGLVGSASKILSSMDRLIRDLRKSSQSRLAAYASSVEKQLLAHARRRDSIITSLGNAQKRLADLQKEASDYAAKATGAILDTGNITSASGGFTGIVGMLTGAVAKARQFAAAITSLRKAGLNATSLDQIVQAGPESGLAAAQALLEAGRAGIGQVNALVGQLGSAAKQVGSSASSAMYSAGIAAAQGLVRGLQSQQSAIAKTMAKLASSLVAKLKKDLKIHSPSRVTENEVGAPIGQGVVAGMLKQIRSVQSASSALAGAALTGPLALAPAGVSLASGARSYRGMPAYGQLQQPAAASSGPLVKMDIHPRAGQSEQEIGMVAANRVMARLRGRGR